MAVSTPGCYLWQREASLGVMSALQICTLNATDPPNTSLYKESLMVIQHTPRSKPTHLPATIGEDSVSYQWEESVPMSCSMDQWQDDCCFSVTNVLLSLSWQSRIEMTLCGLADGRGHDNQSVEPFLFVLFFFVLLLIVKYRLKSWKKMFANILSCSDQTGHCTWIKKTKSMWNQRAAATVSMWIQWRLARLSL